jgi:hypothetical protein
MLATSDDEGKTWTSPFEVDDVLKDPLRKYPEVWSSEIAVNNKGIVAVTWFDDSNGKDGEGGTLHISDSHDGGETFSRSVQVGTGSTELIPSGPVLFSGIEGFDGSLSIGTDTRYATFGGDTQALAADAAGNFHPVWIDNRTRRSQIWTSSIAVHEIAVRHGDPALSSLKDVTSSLGFAIANPQYDTKAQTITGDVALTNISKSAIRLPIRLRITRIDSLLGAATVQGSENGLSGPGALFTFTAPRGTLAPNASTEPIHMAFHVVNPRQLTADDTNGMFLPYISVNFHAYA